MFVEICRRRKVITIVEALNSIVIKDPRETKETLEVLLLNKPVLVIELEEQSRNIRHYCISEKRFCWTSLCQVRITRFAVARTTTSNSSSTLSSLPHPVLLHSSTSFV
jgi:hypothetical protein